MGSGTSRMMVGERKRMCHTVTQDSTILKQVVSLLQKGILLFLKTDMDVSTFVRFHEVCLMFCHVSDLQGVSWCGHWYILICVVGALHSKLWTRWEHIQRRADSELA